MSAQLRIRCPKCGYILLTSKSICGCGTDLTKVRMEAMVDIFDAILDDEKERILNRNW